MHYCHQQNQEVNGIGEVKFTVFRESQAFNAKNESNTPMAKDLCHLPYIPRITILIACTIHGTLVYWVHFCTKVLGKLLAKVHIESVSETRGLEKRESGPDLLSGIFRHRSLNIPT